MPLNYPEGSGNEAEAAFGPVAVDSSSAVLYIVRERVSEQVDISE